MANAFFKFHASWKNWTLLIMCGLLSSLFAADNTLQQPIRQEKTALNIDEATATKLGIVFETVDIEIEGLKKDYNFLWIADFHLIADDISDVEEKNVSVIQKLTRSRSGYRYELQKLHFVSDLSQASDVALDVGFKV